jgi:hypothetical protein
MVHRELGEGNPIRAAGYNSRLFFVCVVTDNGFDGPLFLTAVFVFEYKRFAVLFGLFEKLESFLGGWSWMVRFSRSSHEANMVSLFGLMMGCWHFMCGHANAEEELAFGAIEEGAGNNTQIPGCFDEFQILRFDGAPDLSSRIRIAASASEESSGSIFPLGSSGPRKYLREAARKRL